MTADELAVSCRVTKKGVAEVEAGRHVATATTRRGEKIILRYCYAMRINAAAEQVLSSSTSSFIGCVPPCEEGGKAAFGPHPSSVV